VRLFATDVYGRRADVYDEDCFVPIDESAAAVKQRVQPSSVYVHTPLPVLRDAPEAASQRRPEPPAPPTREAAVVGAGVTPVGEFTESVPQVRDAELPCHEQPSARQESGTGIPNPCLRFEDAGFPPAVLELLQGSGFAAPTPIQSASWPVVLSGRDAVGLARTGGGKTLAYLLPCLMHAASRPPAGPGDGPVALVLAPTRELVLQIQTECFRFGEVLGVAEAALYGGVARNGQLKALRQGPAVCIATPGRLIDFLESGAVSLKGVSYLVVDEADRMLDMGFGPQLRSIVSKIPPNRQTLMWSATWPREIQHLAREICREEPVKLNIGGDGHRGNPNIKQEVHVVSELDKRQRFFDWLRDVSPAGAEQPRILIFTETKRAADALCRELRYEQFTAASMHSDKDQSERDRIMFHFRTGRVGILVATDVAQRGLDIHGIAHVVNFDLPKTPEDYLHRIGRTGRASEAGTAVTFFALGRATPEKLRMARAIVDAMQSVGQTPPAELQRLAERD